MPELSLSLSLLHQLAPAAKCALTILKPPVSHDSGQNRIRSDNHRGRHHAVLGQQFPLTHLSLRAVQTFSVSFMVQ